MSSLAIPPPRTPLHLYRHLLREASYLPLSARPYVLARIHERFRRCRRPTSNPRSLLKQANHHLRRLRAANAGDHPRMRALLLAVFGRTGQRRRSLLSSFVKKEPPEDTAALEKMLDEISEDKKIRRRKGAEDDWLAKWDLSKLRAFAASQLKAGLRNSPTGTLVQNHLHPEKHVPTVDSWGRPISARLARSKLRTRWKMTAHKLQPPLPTSEWKMLGDIAAGRTEKNAWEMPKRRPVARVTESEERENWDWQAYATRRVQVVDKQKSRRLRLLSGETDTTSPAPVPSPLHRHTYTERTLRRLYDGIWRMTAMAEKMTEKKPDGTGWRFTWGKAVKRVPEATGGEISWFEGLDCQAMGARGRTPKPERKTIC